MKVIIDHLRGSRRGQRQEFARPERLAIGRHPRSDVSFDANRDLDASSRHAELRSRGESYALCDIGSSNGTFVDGERIGELELAAGKSVEVEFGAGGPILRIWVGGDDDVPEPADWRERATLGRLLPLALVVVAVVTLLVALLRR